jgi:hypothetical protein
MGNNNLTTKTIVETLPQTDRQTDRQTGVSLTKRN